MKIYDNKVIENCYGCGHCVCSPTTATCTFEGQRTIETFDYFPDWCPLPDQAPPTPKKPEPVRPLASHPEYPNPLKTQVGGDHYKSMAIQPVEFIIKNDIDFVEGNIIKYACRWKSKNGIEDLEKIIHFAQILIKSEEDKK